MLPLFWGENFVSLFPGTRCQDSSLPWSSLLTRKQFPASASQSSRWKSSESWRVPGTPNCARDMVSWMGACTPPCSHPRLGPLDLLAGGVLVLLALPPLASFLAASWRCPRRRVRRCVRGAGDGAAGRDGPDAPNGPTIRRAAPPSGGHRLGVGGAGGEWKCTVPSLVHFGMPHCGQGQEDRQRWEESVVDGAPEAPWSSHPPNRCW